MNLSAYQPETPSRWLSCQKGSRGGEGQRQPEKEKDDDDDFIEWKDEKNGGNSRCLRNVNDIYKVYTGTSILSLSAYRPCGSRQRALLSLKI
jgi:hypothetical protein